MRTDLSALAALLAVGSMATDALGSGPGAAIYIAGPGKAPVKQASCETGVCAGDASYAYGQRVGFAGVDPATPGPCTADGGCHPNRVSFGYTPTRWRKWPGANYGGPSPDLADPAGELPVIEPPIAADEDKSSPPPIEDSPAEAEEASETPELPGGAFEVTPQAPGAAPAAGNRDLPGVEIDLPPLPDVGLPPLPRPAGPGTRGDSPPALPFGFLDPAERTPQREARAPAPPAFRTPPARLPSPAASDAPPELPAGFSSAPPRALLRRLPSTVRTTRFDAAVRPVAAYQPVR